MTTESVDRQTFTRWRTILLDAAEKVPANRAAAIVKDVLNRTDYRHADPFDSQWVMTVVNDVLGRGEAPNLPEITETVAHLCLGVAEHPLTRDAEIFALIQMIESLLVALGLVHLAAGMTLREVKGLAVHRVEEGGVDA